MEFMNLRTFGRWNYVTSPILIVAGAGLVAAGFGLVSTGFYENRIAQPLTKFSQTKQLQAQLTDIEKKRDQRFNQLSLASFLNSQVSEPVENTNNISNSDELRKQQRVLASNCTIIQNSFPSPLYQVNYVPPVSRDNKAFGTVFKEATILPIEPYAEEEKGYDPVFYVLAAANQYPSKIEDYRETFKKEMGGKSK